MAEPWEYVRVYLAGFDEVPVVLTEVVRPWLAAHRADLAQWFFIQYVDAAGPHVRIRWRTHGPAPSVRADLVDLAWAACEVLAERRTGGDRVVVRRHYGPEAAKFPGPALDLAHRIAHLGSETAVELVEHRTRVPVVAQSAAHLLAVCSALGSRLPPGFLYHYGWYWTGRGSIGRAWQGVVEQRRRGPEQVAAAAARARGAALRVLADPSVGGPLARYADDVARLVVTRAGAWPGAWTGAAWVAGPGRRPSAPYRPHPVSLTAHHHLHLMNNRLGVLPLQEAYVARLLALSDPRRAEPSAAGEPAA